MKYLFFVLLFMIGQNQAQVPIAELVKDINAGHFDGKIGCLVKINDNTVLFFAEDEYYGRELWTTDGTRNGTRMVKDIASGRISSTEGPFYDNAFRKPVALNGIMYFVANDGVHKEQLWRSDGTAMGTFALTEKFPTPKTPFTSSYLWLFTFGDSVYFWRGTANSKWDLYKTQGTVASTLLVKELGFGFKPSSFVVFKNVLHFLGKRGDEPVTSLWKTDGTSVGTVKTGPVFPNLSKYLAVVNNELYCFVNNQGGLWKTDGTVAGTKQVRAMDGYSYSTKVTEANNLAYFWSGERISMGCRLWRSNGELMGTMAVSTEQHTNSFLVYKDRCYFTHQRKVEQGHELWTTNGTPETTLPFSTSFTGESPSYFTESNGLMYYFAGLPSFDNRSKNGLGIWQTNGTPTETRLIGQLGEKIRLPKNPDFYRGDTEGFDGFEEDAFLVLGENLLFIAQNNLSSGDESTGIELYRIPLNRAKLMNTPSRTSSANSSQSSTSQFENFKVFIQRFSTDKNFQLSRVKFPFKSESLIDDEPPKNTFIQSNKWKHIDYTKPSWMSKGRSGIGNWTIGDGDDNNENTYFMGACGCLACECGYFMSNHFQRIGGKWFLIKEVIVSN